MSGILDQLTQQLTGSALSSLSESIGADQAQTKTALSAALPVLLGALAKNAAKPDGAEALSQALTRDHDGSILDDLAGAMRTPNLSDGQGILKHVLGGREQNVTAGLAKASGLGGDQTAKMLQTLAPLVLGSLGRARAQNNMGADALSSLLAGEKKQIQASKPGMEGLLSGLLDKDGDGQIIDDVASSLLGRLFNN